MSEIYTPEELLAYTTPAFEPRDAADEVEAARQIAAYDAGHVAGGLAIALELERWNSEAKDQEIAGLQVQVRRTAEREAHYRHRAETDQKVGLLTPTAFFEKVSAHVANSQRESDQGVTNFLMIIDIDYFKTRINDTFGHMFGDEVLKELAACLRQDTREEDEIGRFGGEEFICFFRGASLEDSLAMAERFQNNLTNISLRSIAERRGTDGVPEMALNRHVTVSIGMAELPQGGDPAQAAALADEALYHVKHHGRDNIAVHDGTAPRITLRSDDWLFE